MPEIHIERSHPLGLARAREVARQWASQAEQDYGLACQYRAGDGRDLVQFSGAGIGGSLEVTADSFALHAKLGFLLGNFGALIEQKVVRNLDELLGQEEPPQPGWA